MRSFQKDKIIGIVGGMGPRAGLVLFDQILEHTNALCDQDHLSTILISLPRYIGDRSAFLLDDLYENPAYAIVEIIKKLEIAGVEVVGIPCNTAFAPRIYNIILKELKQVKSNVRIINLPDEICAYIKENVATGSSIGLMTTNGTYKSKLYENLISDLDYDLIVPDVKFQNEVVHNIIYNRTFGIKANPKNICKEALLLFDEALDFFRERKTDAIIFGCTEFSIILDVASTENMIKVDSTLILAKALLREVSKKHN